ncbi:hypothetical protein RQ831_02580 [Roseomonas gilardii]|uniref:Uncharacterized protein n=1 Tax=Roseomonas gilardii TaxID=257708 RepID=A0ABU3MAN8_9PROT|nr:hypothetical protein [Roseomonas gilardii]MDT8329922.1 hypothetical protein [Roseomonas gilardii]
MYDTMRASMSRLSNDDFSELANFAENGDRYSYWSLLTNRGSNYGGLALAVVTNEDRAGFIANSYRLMAMRQRMKCFHI